MKQKRLFIILGLLGMVFLLTIRPLPLATEDNCAPFKGVVEDIYEGEGEKDIVFALQNDENYYYINRGLDQGLEIEKLRAELLNQTVNICFVKHWSPLNPTNSTRHVGLLELNEERIYSEL